MNRGILFYTGWAYAAGSSVVGSAVGSISGSAVGSAVGSVVSVAGVIVAPSSNIICLNGLRISL